MPNAMSTLEARDTSPPRELYLRLMVVEDDPDHRATVAEVLEEEGYTVETATHGRDALDRLSAARPLPDLILLDMLMPVMDGWVFMSELKKHPVLSTIPVLVISTAGDRVLSRAPVAAGYLSKPLAKTKLLDTISRCLRQRSYRSQNDL